jgi:hypothetical protein
VCVLDTKNGSGLVMTGGEEEGAHKRPGERI